MSSLVVSARNARREAEELAGSEWQPAVLEPSPPAVDDGEWYADDPVSGSGAQALLPSGIERDGSTTWHAWAESNPEHAAWVTRRWLGGSLSLPPSPADLVSTRLALHRLAAYVIAPVRHRANGKFGLRWTLGGFGTPFFAEDRQIRVAGTRLIDQRRDTVRTTPITTLAAAAEFLETSIDDKTAAEHDSPPVGDVDEPLAIGEASSTFLGDWYGMAFAALERVRADPDSVDSSRPQLWPGHFDPAIEIGDEDHRGSYGASPGDDAIAEPYLYVSVWWPDRLALDPDDPVWNAPSFTGAVLKLADFGEGNPVDIATDFFTSTRDRITR